MKTYRIAIAGHSRSGKTSVLKLLQFSHSIHGIKLAEVAQLFFENRLQEVWDEDSPLIRQDTILRTQLGIENVVIKMAESFGCESFFIISDRGCFDAEVYMPDYSDRMLKAVGSPPPIDLALILLPPDDHSPDDDATVRVDVDAAEDERLRKAVVRVWSAKTSALSHVFIPPAASVIEKAKKVSVTINDFVGFHAIEVKDDESEHNTL